MQRGGERFDTNDALTGSDVLCVDVYDVTTANGETRLHNGNTQEYFT